MAIRTPAHSAAQHTVGRRRGLTFIELLVITAIAGVLLILLLPAAAYARSRARDAGCKSNLRQLWGALSYYANDHGGALPVNHATPGRISNILYKDRRRTGWGPIHPRYLRDYHVFFCPNDPGRGPAWEYGWSN